MGVFHITSSQNVTTLAAKTDKPPDHSAGCAVLLCAEQDHVEQPSSASLISFSTVCFTALVLFIKKHNKMLLISSAEAIFAESEARPQESCVYCVCLHWFYIPNSPHAT